jgi:hypothetical protein
MGSNKLVAVGLILILLGAGCTQVPKESVELSTTVGRDVSSVYQSHRELALLFYERIENDVKEFVDEVYAPYQIGHLLRSDQEDFSRGDSDSLFAALESALQRPDDARAQQDALETMEIFVEFVREDIESYRAERLSPVQAQKEALLTAIDRAYNQIVYANAIVTGYLASVVEVRDAQNEILAEFGVQDLQKTVGGMLAETSVQVEKFTKNAKRIDGTLEGADKKLMELTQELDRILSPSE